jgi:hypothetical protein
MSVAITLLRLANEFITKNPSLIKYIEYALKDISDNPYVDMETKFIYRVPPCVISIYMKDKLWILYHLNDNCTQVNIWNIGKHGDKVTF